MTVNFRCARCGQAVSSEAAPATMTRCPHCGARTEVPASLASLPRPIVSPDLRPTGPAFSTASAGAAAVAVSDDPVMGTMSRLMPYVISVFLHAGVLVILAFITVVVLGQAPDKAVAVPVFTVSKDPGKLPDRPPGQPTTKDPLKRVEQQFQSPRHDRTITDPVTSSPRQVQVIGVGGPPSGPPGPLRIGPPDTGPPTFIGISTGKRGGYPHAIVYVLDRSGSMLDTFDDVRGELVRSLGTLGPGHDFHVIFFAAGAPMENPPRRMVPASDANRLQAWDYVKTIQPIGQTDVIPALRRAFAVLADVPDKKMVEVEKENGQVVKVSVDVQKVIYLLTDGEFSDNEMAVKETRRLNAGGRVQVHTILHRHRSPAAMKVLSEIAESNGGKFKFVEPE